MSRLYLLVFFQVLLFSVLNAQVDSVPATLEEDSVTTPLTDSIVKKEKPVIARPISPLADSFSLRPIIKDSGWVLVDSIPLAIQILRQHPYFGFGSKPTALSPVYKKPPGKELLFYALIALLLLFAFLRQAFTKYYNDLFRLFFRTTLKYRQIREQLMQTPLPSLLLNGFFVLVGGMYISLLLIHFNLIGSDEFWLYTMYACLGLAGIYFLKFLGLKLIGWIFNLRDAADSYIFIVFVINKVLGVFLLPFIVMLAFMSGTGYTIALMLSWFGVGALFLYRYILTYAAVRNQVRFNPFHFFLYICAFEIAPLLLIYKLLLVFFQ
ncbi:MAG TPA: DUF4271 domain-containing protein [Chitinophagaceae bacterium]|nr:DUF4271 domain-containing protein [Chitinophagaceae bacterium]